MNTNRILITIIVVAVVLVGVFTVRALLNSQEVLSPEPSEVPESANTIESQEESIADVTANETSSDSMSSEPEVAAQPDWTSALDLIRIVEISVQPHDFGFDDQGNLFVVSADVSNPQIMKYDQEGNMLASWGSRGSGPGEFEFASPPGGPPMEGGFLVLDETGKVYVSDPYNNRVQTFDSDGNYLGEWTQLGEGGDHFNVPGPLSTDANGNIFVADFDGVHQFKLDGSYVGMLETTGEVAANSKGELYATIAFQNLVAKLDQDGQVQDTWGGEGDSEDGMFDFPMLMVIDKQDNIYVADHSGRLQIFDTEGNFLGRFNMTTLELLQLKIPVILAMDADNQIYAGAADRKIIYVLRPLQESETTDIFPEGSIAAALEADGRFSTFLALFSELRGADLRPWPFLQNPEYSASLFVPTDEAFSRLSPEHLERLKNDPAFALQLLNLHTIDKRLHSQDFGLLKSWPTGIANQQVVIEIDGDKITFEGASVIETDIEAGSRSMIHVIDEVTGLERMAGN